MAASFFALARLARSGPLFTAAAVLDLFAIPALPLAVDQRDPKASLPAPPELDVDWEVLPRDAAGVEDCF